VKEKIEEIAQKIKRHRDLELTIGATNIVYIINFLSLLNSG
jgi:hypothetical protein